MQDISTRYTQMQSLKKRIGICTNCDLAKTRVNVVCGSGDVNTKLVLVGEGPSAADNHTGFPFSGPAGNMLDEVLVASGLTRSDIWLTNIIKCRAVTLKDGELQNRLPRAREIKACLKWLDSELTLIQPSVILCLGAPAAKTLICPRFRITKERGVWFSETRYAPFAMATFNPAYVLRQEGDNFTTMRRTIINDIGEAKRKLDEAKDIPRSTLF